MRRLVVWSRAALNDARDQAAFVAMDNPSASRRLADKLRETADALGDMAIGRPGRVTGTYEKSVPRLPYIIVYAIESRIEGEMIVILRVIHTARDWPEGGWPQ